MEQGKFEPEFFNIPEIKISYEPGFKVSLRPKVANSQTAAEILRQCWDAGSIQLQESFKVMLLNTACRVLGIYNLSQGGMSGTLVDPQLILTVALKSAATTLILAHNHPSGTLSPSQNDIKQTNKVVLAAELLQIRVVDHIILTAEGFYSFGDAGLL